MSTSKSVALKTALLLTAAVNLTGCVTSLKHLDLGRPQVDSLGTNKTMSVAEMLAQARGQEAASTTEDNLYIKFEPQKPHLNSEQEKTLLRFAELNSAMLVLECAPSQHADPFTAATIAIKRCNTISTFLSDHAFDSEMALAPDLQPDQVRIYR